MWKSDHPTFDSNYNLSSFWIWCHQQGTPLFGWADPFLYAAPQAPVWIGSVGAHPLSGLSSTGFKFRPLKHIHRVVLKSLLWYLGCVLTVVVLLKDEPRPVWGQQRSGAGFHPGHLCTSRHSSFPLSGLVSQFLPLSLPLKNIPREWCCCHYASL